jgi:GT2 family glycosyltransferase
MKVIEEIGLMDEKYFAYYDDTDFVLRAIRKGYKLWYEPTIQINHKVSSSSGEIYPPFISITATEIRFIL